MKNSLSISLNEQLVKDINGMLEPLLQKNNCFLHLGCRDGSLAFSVAPLVGAGGKVIGLENEASFLRDIYGVLPDIADKLDYDNMYFYHGQNHELRTDVYRQSTLFKRLKMDSFEGFTSFSNRCVDYFNNNPVVVSKSTDVLFSSIDLSKLTHFQLVELFHEAARVLKDQGALLMASPDSNSQFHKNINEYIKILGGAGFESIDYLSGQFEQTTCCGTQVLNVIRASRSARTVAKEQKPVSSVSASCC